MLREAAGLPGIHYSISCKPSGQNYSAGHKISLPYEKQKPKHLRTPDLGFILSEVLQIVYIGPCTKFLNHCLKLLNRWGEQKWKPKLFRLCLNERREVVILFLLEITALFCFFSLNICQVHVDNCKKKKKKIIRDSSHTGPFHLNWILNWVH